MEEGKSQKIRNMRHNRAGGAWEKHLVKPFVAGQPQFNPNHLRWMFIQPHFKGHVVNVCTCVHVCSLEMSAYVGLNSGCDHTKSNALQIKNLSLNLNLCR